MSNFWQQLFSLITSTPGNLSYHLVLTFAIGGALALVLYSGQQRDVPQVRRLSIGLKALFALRLLLFGFALLAWQGLANSHTLLPIVDRAITTLGLLILLWIWVFPEGPTNIDHATILVGILILAFAGLSLGLWSETGNTSLAFNEFWLDGVWATASLLLAIAGGALLATRKPESWEIGLSMMVLLAIGHLIHLIAPNLSSDFPGAVRLTQMAAYPLLLALPARYQPLIGIRVFPTQAPADRPITSERRRYTAAPKTLASILTLMASQNGEDICHHTTKAMARVMVADICLLISPPDSSGNLSIHCGYDLIRETEIEGRSIDRKQVPLLASAIERKRPLRLPASSTSADLINLGQLLGLGHAGHILAAPIPGPNQDVLAGLVLLSPYARRTWTTADQEYLKPILPLLGQVIVNQREKLRLKDQLASLQTEVEGLRNAAEAKANGVPKSAETASTVELLSKELERAQQSLLALERENKELYENFSRAEQEAEQEIERLNSELRLALEEIAHLKDLLSEAQAQLDTLRKQLPAESQSVNEPGDDQQEIITSLAQELRQPMSSIVGYTDLLLGESVGILGALQRKFLERIKASITRMEGLLDDLIRVVMDTPDRANLTPTPVDLAEIIDQAIAQSQQHLREKDILLKVDLPEVMPRLIADRDALQQILMHLLNNASLVTPENGEIVLKIRQITEDGQGFVLIQVTDSGGGIPEEDIPRVFSRLYRADNPLIEGVGDTGVGLSIAKTLTEAQHGRIWVESQAGMGATFSVMLPMNAFADQGASA